MIVLNVFLSLKPEREADFLAFWEELCAKSRAEAGNISYALYKRTDARHAYAIIEEWKDSAAIEEHNGTPHFQAFAAQAQAWVSEPLSIKTYHSA